MKYRSSLKADPSKGDIVVIRQGRRRIVNKLDPNRNQAQAVKTIQKKWK